MNVGWEAKGSRIFEKLGYVPSLRAFEVWLILYWFVALMLFSLMFLEWIKRAIRQISFFTIMEFIRTKASGQPPLHNLLNLRSLLRQVQRVRSPGLRKAHIAIILHYLLLLLQILQVKILNLWGFLLWRRFHSRILENILNSHRGKVTDHWRRRCLRLHSTFLRTPLRLRVLRSLLLIYSSSPTFHKLELPARCLKTGLESRRNIRASTLLIVAIFKRTWLRNG